MRIDIVGAKKSFADGERPAIDGIDLSIADGELVALLGPSGSGKTTLLRAIAGLVSLDAGEIRFDGVDVAGRDTRDRNVGFVFQHYALFRTMTVLENVGFGLSVRPRATRPRKAKIAARARELLRLVHLEELENRYPAQLSGGQRQRVALARALAIDPSALLLDEPFGALDAKVRKDLRRWLRTLHDQTGHTTVFVTHDQEEALELADRVAVLDNGRIVQVATPTQLYDHPATPFVCAFLGSVNRLELDTPEGRREVFVRAHHIALVPPGMADALPGEIKAVRTAGARLHVDVRLDSGATAEVEIAAEDYAAAGWRIGDRAGAVIRRYHAF